MAQDGRRAQPSRLRRQRGAAAAQLGERQRLQSHAHLASGNKILYTIGLEIRCNVSWFWLCLNRKTALIIVRQSVFSETGAVWARTQPHVVMLAELQYRAARSAASRNATLHRLSPLVFATASFLAGFAERRGESKAIFETRRSMLWLTLSVGSQRVPAGRTESSSISRRR